jgi:hypothetical protein
MREVDFKVVVILRSSALGVPVRLMQMSDFLERWYLITDK